MAIVTLEIEATNFGRHAGDRQYTGVPSGDTFLSCMEGATGTDRSYQIYEGIEGLNHEWYGHWNDPTGLLNEWQFRRPSIGWNITGITGRNILSAEVDIYSTSGCSFGVTSIKTDVTPQFTPSNIYWNDPNDAFEDHANVISSLSSLSSNQWETFTLTDPTVANERSDWLTTQILTTDYEIKHNAQDWTATGYFYYLAMDATRKPILRVTYSTVPKQIWTV